MHSVLLMCEHSGEGAYGLVVNRPANLVVRTLLPDHPVLGESDFPVHLGGPVDHSTLQFVHRVPDRIPGGYQLTEEVWLGGELDALAEVLAADPLAAEDSVRLLVGYSGWGEGQLDFELSRGSWIPAPSDADAVFSNDSEGAWRKVVRSIGPGGAGLERLPPDVRWN
jgi:putative transcriptional regulator